MTSQGNIIPFILCLHSVSTALVLALTSSRVNCTDVAIPVNESGGRIINDTRYCRGNTVAYLRNTPEAVDIITKAYIGKKLAKQFQDNTKSSGKDPVVYSTPSTGPKPDSELSIGVTYRSIVRCLFCFLFVACPSQAASLEIAPNSTSCCLLRFTSWVVLPSSTAVPRKGDQPKLITVKHVLRVAKTNSLPMSVCVSLSTFPIST